MAANVPKCVCLAKQASTGKPYDPKLVLNGQPIPYIGDSTFTFLGAPVNINDTDHHARNDLCKKLTRRLEKVDATLLSRQQKLLLYKLAVCPRLTWDLSVHSFPTTWLQTTLQPIATEEMVRPCLTCRHGLHLPPQEQRWPGAALLGDPVQEAPC